MHLAFQKSNVVNYERSMEPSTTWILVLFSRWRNHLEVNSFLFVELAALGKVRLNSEESEE